MTSAKRTTNHDTIQRWAESRNATPACVSGTGARNDVGMIRLDFPGYSGKMSLKPISWNEFFKKFDESDLALLYQDKTASGKRSNFNKLVSRQTPRKRKSESRSSKSSRRSPRKKSSSRTRH
jgi:hypothetical protein